MVRKLIRADGTEIEVGRMSMGQIRNRLGADTLDTVMLQDRTHVMILDDMGHPKGLPVNVSATALYHEVCKPGTTHVIRGDVIIVPDEDFA